MPAPKGHPRYGGRQKGTKNKFKMDLYAICQEHDCHPFVALIKMVKNESHPRHFDAVLAACNKLFPESKVIAHAVQPIEEASQLDQEIVRLMRRNADGPNEDQNLI